MIVKRLREAWRGRQAGSLVLVDDDHDATLVQTAVLEPTAEVKRLIREWEGPDGVVVPAGTRVELDAATAAELTRLGLLGPTAID